MKTLLSRGFAVVVLALVSGSPGIPLAHAGAGSVSESKATRNNGGFIPSEWVDRRIPYYVCHVGDSDCAPVDADYETMIHDALREMSTETPITFLRMDHRPTSGAYISYESGSDAVNVDCDDPKKHQGPNHVGSCITFVIPAAAGPDHFRNYTVKHETGHALGLIHEDQRSDRLDYIEYHCDVEPDQCDADGQPTDANFKELTYDVMFFTPFDRDSIMIDRADIIGTREHPFFTSRTGDEYIGWVDEMSPEDMNALYQMYEPQLGTENEGGALGSAMVAADFDGDGYTDLAVGVPDRESDGIAGGAVYLYKGTWASGLVPWKVLSASDSGLTANAGAGFGSSLAARDLDGNGAAELFVGAPGFTPIPGGAVFVYRGGRLGPAPAGYLWEGGVPHRMVHEPNGLYVQTGEVMIFTWTGSAFTWKKTLVESADANVPLGVDNFGHAVVEADFDNDHASDLAIGANHGGPGRAGQVLIFKGPEFTGTPQRITLAGQNPQSTDSFGYALAAGDIDKSPAGTRELAIGAPGRFGSGQVYVCQWIAGRMNLRPQPLGTNAQPGSAYGRAVAIGRLYEGQETGDLLVGAPHESGDGAVHLFIGQPDSTLLDVETLVPNQFGGHFGWSMAAGDFDDSGTQAFAVGLPEAAGGDGGFLEYWPLGGGFLRRTFQVDTHTYR